MNPYCTKPDFIRVWTDGTNEDGTELWFVDAATWSEQEYTEMCWDHYKGREVTDRETALLMAEEFRDLLYPGLPILDTNPLRMEYV